MDAQRASGGTGEGEGKQGKEKQRREGNERVARDSSDWILFY